MGGLVPSSVFIAVMAELSRRAGVVIDVWLGGNSGVRAANSSARFFQESAQPGRRAELGDWAPM